VPKRFGTFTSINLRDTYIFAVSKIGLGGQYKGDAQVTIGPVGFVSAGSITVDTAVIGVGGITVREGTLPQLLFKKLP
jgi:DeoR/GlpR family transcriptional regulator of sugar metabolism